jgi:hypothetical protein
MKKRKHDIETKGKGFTSFQFELMRMFIFGKTPFGKPMELF